MVEEKENYLDLDKATAKDVALDDFYIPVMDVWDAINDLSQLSCVVTLVWFLTGPKHLQADDEFEIFHGFFADISTRLAEACDCLEKARANLKVFKREAKA